MCPQGHGSVYTLDSVHGADMSDRWIGFPNLYQPAFSMRARMIAL